MIYDMRIYDVKRGSVPECEAAMRDVGLQIRADYGVKLAGWYYMEVGPLNRIVHIWAYDNYAHFESANKGFRSDPRWTNDYMPRVKDLIVKQQTMIMRAGDFFPGAQ
jgi:hypothetical protein